MNTVVRNNIYRLHFIAKALAWEHMNTEAQMAIFRPHHIVKALLWVHMDKVAQMATYRPHLIAKANRLSTDKQFCVVLLLARRNRFVDDEVP